MRHPTRAGWWLGLSLGATAACAGGDRETPEAAEREPPPAVGEPAVASGYRVVAVTEPGSIIGTVSFEGPVPAPQTIPSPDVEQACGATQTVRHLRVADDGALADAVVSLNDIASGAALERPESPPVLDQTGCRFVPHIRVVPMGASVEVRNSDPVTHNVHTAAFENRPINRSQPAGGEPILLQLTSPEIVRVKCDLHSWMGAWIVVAGHPYYALTGGDGRFTLDNVPPGVYTLSAWHETLGRTTVEVTVAAGETTEIAVTMSASQTGP